MDDDEHLFIYFFTLNQNGRLSWAISWRMALVSNPVAADTFASYMKLKVDSHSLL